MDSSNDNRKGWFGRLRDSMRCSSSLNTPLSGMRDFVGLATAYWRHSDEKLLAYTLTAGVVAFSWMLGQSSPYVADAWANVLDSMYRLAPGSEERSTMENVRDNAMLLAGIVFTRLFVLAGARHLCSSNLNRRARGWLQDQFNQALFDGQHAHMHMTSDQTQDPKSSMSMPDNLDQRIDEPTGAFYGGLIGLSMGAVTTTSSFIAVFNKMQEFSTPLEMIKFAGAYGTSMAALMVASAYVIPNTMGAFKIGTWQKMINLAKQKASGNWRGEMGNAFRHSTQIASAKGEETQLRIHRQLYEKIDRIWFVDTMLDSFFLGYKNIYNYAAAKGVSYLPFLIPYRDGDINLQQFLLGEQLTSELIGDMSWFFHVMPDIANISANTKRLTDVSKAREEIFHLEDFARQRGISQFTRRTQDTSQGIGIKDLQIMLPGKNGEILLEAEDLQFRPGQWTMLVGDNGCGKSTLLKTITQKWLFGRGEISMPEGQTLFFIGQDPHLPEHLSLKEQLTYPAKGEEFDDTEIAALLHRLGLGKFIAFMHDNLHQGKSWKNQLSGGQKQKVVQGRILLHKPGVLLADEPTSAMDTQSKKEFWQSIRDESPNTIVLAIEHYESMPRFRDGSIVFNQIAHCNDRRIDTHAGMWFEAYREQKREENRTAHVDASQETAMHALSDKIIANDDLPDNQPRYGENSP